MPPSSSGLRHLPFKLEITGSNPVGGTMNTKLNIEIRSGEGGDDAALFARQLTGALGR